MRNAEKTFGKFFEALGTLRGLRENFDARKAKGLAAPLTELAINRKIGRASEASEVVCLNELIFRVNRGGGVGLTNLPLLL